MAQGVEVQAAVSYPHTSVRFRLEILPEAEMPESYGRCYYPYEGNKIVLSSGLSRAQASITLCHEIGHLIDWYMNQGKQSTDEGVREQNAANIAGGLLTRMEQIKEGK